MRAIVNRRCGGPEIWEEVQWADAHRLVDGGHKRGNAVLIWGGASR